MVVITSWNTAETFIGNPFSPPAARTDDMPALSILTYNIEGGGVIRRKRQQDLVKQIQELDAEVVCLQEFYKNDKILKSLFEHYPYIKERRRQVILSRYPIVGFKDLEVGKKYSGNGAISADIERNGRIFRVFNFHLRSVGITQRLNRMSSQPDIEDKKWWGDVRHILARVKDATQIRTKQLPKLRAAIASSPYPAIVCGDFNDPPQSYTYHFLSEGLKDAFARRGKGLGFTFNGNIPLLKIDYTLVSPGIEVLSTRIIPSRISDHRPMITQVALP